MIADKGGEITEHNNNPNAEDASLNTASSTSDNGNTDTESESDSDSDSDNDSDKIRGNRGRKLGNLRPTWENDPSKALLRRKVGVLAEWSPQKQRAVMHQLRVATISACGVVIDRNMSDYKRLKIWYPMVDSKRVLSFIYPY